MAEYLPAYWPGRCRPFEEEALKAQVVAARSYILYRISHPDGAHPGAAVCDQGTCCLPIGMNSRSGNSGAFFYSKNMEKMRKAVRETDGSTLPMMGNSSGDVPFLLTGANGKQRRALGFPFPTLSSVPSPETEKDVPNYITTVEVSVGDFLQAFWA